MKYLIAHITAGSPGSIEIDEDEYNLISTAREDLFEALYLEEKLDLVTENYHEYEAELLSLSSRMVVFNDDDYFSMGRERNLITRRISNLLGASKMYLDQSLHHLTNIYGEDSDVLAVTKRERASQYDQNFGYRFMEAIRNYAEHRDFPIEGIKLYHQRIDNDNGPQFLHQAIPLINIHTLQDDEKFKRTILDEIRHSNKQDFMDARPLIRQYIEGIGTLHVKTRELMLPDLKVWEKVLDDTITKYKKGYGESVSLTGLAIIKENDNRNWDETKTLFKEFIERRLLLEDKNKSFINLHKSYASNEIRNND